MYIWIVKNWQSFALWYFQVDGVELFTIIINHFFKIIEVSISAIIFVCFVLF